MYILHLDLMADMLLFLTPSNVSATCTTLRRLFYMYDSTRIISFSRILVSR